MAAAAAGAWWWRAFRRLSCLVPLCGSRSRAMGRGSAGAVRRARALGVAWALAPTSRLLRLLGWCSVSNGGRALGGGAEESQ